jgi:hypothetical protein
MLQLIRDLVFTYKPSKLDEGQKDRAAGLMRQLRKCGFTNYELFVLVGKRISEPTRACETNRRSLLFDAYV